MKRRLFNLATAVSLVACCAAAAGWIESYFAYDYLALGSGNGTNWEIVSDAGRIEVRRTIYASRMDDPLFPAPVREVRHWWRFTDFVGKNWGPGGWQWAGFDLELNAPRYAPKDGAPKQVGSTFGVRFPYWFLVLLAVVLPGLRWADLGRERRRRRIAQGLCSKCGYDLRATPERCPECGAVTMNAKTQSRKESPA